MRNSFKKKEDLMCAYCKTLGHDDHHFYLKKIDELKHLLKKNIVKLPDAYKEKDSSSKISGYLIQGLHIT